MKIVTNNVPRFTLDAYDLAPKEREEFDYLNWEAIENGNDSATFVRFKGQLYDLSQFMRANESFGFSGWDGYYSNSASSGILVKFPDGQSEFVIIGTYYS